MWRGGSRFGLSVAVPFVWRCPSNLAVAPFPHPAHRTGPAALPHPALGQDLTPSSTTGRAQAGTGVRAQSTRTGARVDRSRPAVWGFAPTGKAPPCHGARQKQTLRSARKSHLPEYLVHVCRGAPVHVRVIRPIRHQGATVDQFLMRDDPRQVVLRSEIDDARTLVQEDPVHQYDECVRPFLDYRVERRRNRESARSPPPRLDGESGRPRAVRHARRRKRPAA